MDSMAAFSTLLAERDGFNNRLEAPTLEGQ